MSALPHALQDELAAHFGATPTSTRSVSGGDINDAYDVTLGDGRRVFIKTRDGAPEDMYAVEAEGLAWLAEGFARVPEVLGVSPRFLALEFVASGARAPDYEEQLGRMLARLHQQSPGRFGWHRNSYVGPLIQPNESKPTTTWAEFYRTRRLAPMAACGHRRGQLPMDIMRALDELYGRLDDLVGPAEPPARLHGDLWAGNQHVAADGGPMLIDPAVYGGHREIDLAMMQLFGGYGARVFAAYDEVYPRAAGHERRKHLYQLYPFLVHVCLFGAQYVSGVRAALNALR